MIIICSTHLTPHRFPWLDYGIGYAMPVALVIINHSKLVRGLPLHSTILKVKLCRIITCGWRIYLTLITPNYLQNRFLSSTLNDQIHFLWQGTPVSSIPQAIRRSVPSCPLICKTGFTTYTEILKAKVCLLLYTTFLCIRNFCLAWIH